MSWDWDATSLKALSAFLGDRDILHGDLRTRRIGDGHSNLTFLVDDGERRVVVRRPPPPPLPPGAHDVLREARVIGALHGSAVLVPALLATAQAGEVLDAPLFVMSFVPGVVVTDAPPPCLADPASRHGVVIAMADTLGALHAVDWRAAGLDDFGRPEGFNLRHLKRLRGLIADADGKLPDGFADLYDALVDAAPAESGAAIVHNDFRIGNLLLSESGPEPIAAVLDWELATIGDPLFDLGYAIACHPEPGQPLTPTQELSRALLEPGFPSRQALIGRYAERSGRNVQSLNWYISAVNWKLAALYLYSKRKGLDSYYQSPHHIGLFLNASSRWIKRRETY